MAERHQEAAFTPWRGGDLKRALATAHSYVDALIAREIEGLGVTLGEADVLTVVLVAGSDPPAPSQLADWLRLTTAGTTGRLDSLERKALLERRRHRTDGRRLTLHLTPAGTALATKVFEAKDQSLTEVLSQLGDAYAKRLISDLDTLTTAVDARLDPDGTQR